ncbi:acyl-CoA carboxylase epsilon subunit [Streptomyces sp. V1I1]|uniref:acyl-CoA carboxylase epsilon subunit n=1 Tax=Streptomyces sp. V1I1 TaxID=3042272 RepID=UPI00277E155B|nr:acyl-CoA carboxylase epsilon subunit [Streptomyces sp. V1I1]MDQ0945722.1 hypothetical protein [Streptomyces sp. V1I1]
MPPIKVLYGQPTPEELAAVIAVVQARAATAAAPEPPRSPPVSAWTDRAAAIALRRRTLPRLISLTTPTPAEPTR